MNLKTFIKPEYIIDEDRDSNPKARIWKYRLNIEPLVKKVISFKISYSEEEVRRYLKTEEGVKNITLWPVFNPEPPIPKKEGIGCCPICGKPGKIRERRMNGNDTCISGHVYPSKDAIIK